jgi:hypothetical protein
MSMIVSTWPVRQRHRRMSPDHEVRNPNLGVTPVNRWT